jgi:hypothetical protein
MLAWQENERVVHCCCPFGQALADFGMLCRSIAPARCSMNIIIHDIYQVVRGNPPVAALATFGISAHPLWLLWGGFWG